MSDQRIDRELKEMLEGLSAEFNPDHWQAMSNRLDELEANIDEDFDYSASDALQEISPQYNPSHWAMFESSLEKDNGVEAQAFDAKVAKELTQMHIPYNPAHWRRLEILRAERLKRKVQITALRLAECAMLLLLWWGAPMLFDGKPSIPTASQPTYAQTHPDGPNEPNFSTDSKLVDPQTDVSSMKMVHENEAEKMESGVILAQVNEAQVNEALVNEIRVNEVGETKGLKRTASAAPQNGTTPRSTSLPTTHTTELADKPSVPTHSPPIATMPPLMHYPISLSANNISVSLRENHQPAIASTHTIQSHDLAVVDALESLPSLLSDLLASDAQSITFTANELPKLENVLEKKYVSISPYISSDFNAISSHPGIQVLDESELKFLTLTPGIGVDIGFHNEPWAVKTGLGYAYKFYDPNISEQYGSIHGYQELNFNKVAMHVLEIPVRLHFDVLKGLRHSLYVVAGSSLHYIVRQEYDKPRRSLEYNLAGDEKAFSRIQPVLEDNRYESGNFLISFSEASYITADIGIGFERKLNNDLAIYVQPTYQRMFGPGVGPNYDVINTFSLQVGLRL